MHSEKKRDWRGLIGKYKYAALVVAAGILLLTLPGGGEARAEDAAQAPTVDLAAKQAEMEAILQKIEGAGRLRLMLTLADDGALALAQDVKNSAAEGGMTQERQTVVVSQGSGQQDVVVMRRTSPVYKGALVVCEGGGSAQVRLAVTEAVGVLTGLGSDKISVVKGMT